MDTNQHTDQQRVADFVARHDLETDVVYRLLDLVSELGELSKELLKTTGYGRRELRPIDLNANWQSELGDTLFALMCVANSTGVDLEQALDSALSKYERRLSESKDAGSGS